eukprot:CAMPEP_0115034360 /NCGR_PEP_ID=MMETSP0216-20121206/40598_1 /TAXON_ID=223996 /ORGANISM="Protocruzia adherens, Strain Boccale" /LENGTH=206 /DNA_ID=CAMNT_0002413217 /DNA_START=377 /DNA_END=997 /DNA_ORIENTATION=+
MAHHENSDEFLATHTIAMNILVLSFMYTIGVGAASTSYIGNTMGEGHYLLSRRYLGIALLIGLPVLLAESVFLLACSQSVAEVYTRVSELQDSIVAIMPFTVLLIIVDNLQGIFNGILFGLGYIGLPAVCSTVFNLVLGEILVFVLWYYAGMKLEGTYIGVSAGFAMVIVAYVILISRLDFAQKSKEIRVRETLDSPPEKTDGKAD